MGRSRKLLSALDLLLFALHRGAEWPSSCAEPPRLAGARHFKLRLCCWKPQRLSPHREDRHAITNASERGLTRRGIYPSD